MSEGESVYSPGLSKKKKAIVIISAVATTVGLLEARAIDMMWRSTWIGTGFTLSGGGSSLL